MDKGRYLGMCGYFFALDISGADLNFKNIDLDNATQFIKKRGKDFFSCEKYEGGSLIAGHARLAIQGLGEASKQPMVSKNGKLLLLFNGEIYNHFKLRKQYFSNNYCWLSNSDTETILALVELYGFSDAIDKLNGMFSIVVYDFANKKLNIAIDRFGEKPLYYFIDNNLIICANNLDALSALVRNKLSLDESSLQTFFEIGYIPAPKTIFLKVKKLCAGESAEIKQVSNKSSYRTNITNYYDLKVKFNKSYLNNNINFKDEKTTLKNLDSCLESIVLEASISDVPICTTLSGGIDSGLLNYYLSKQINGLDAFHLLCDEYGYNEYDRASSISKKLGINFNVLELSNNNVADSLETISEAYDEPFADSSQIPTLFLSKGIASNYKVCLTGDGLDELFSGYNRHVFLPKLTNSILKFSNSTIFYRLIRNYLSTNLGRSNINDLNRFFSNKTAQVNYGDKLKKVIDLLSRTRSLELNDLYLATIADGESLLTNKNYPKFQPEFIDSRKIVKGLGDLALCYADLKNYLPNDILVKTDRASMHYSLEMRAPFLNNDLLNFAVKIPANFRVRNGKGKYLLRKIFSDKIDSQIGQSAKTGFSIPIGKYINNIYTDKISQLMKSKPFEKIIDYSKVTRIYSNHILGDYQSTQTIWRYLCFILWAEKRGYT